MATSGFDEMCRDVVASPAAGGAEVLGAGVPFSMIEQGPAAAGGALSSAAHPPSTKITPVNTLPSLVSVGFCIS